MSRQHDETLIATETYADIDKMLKQIVLSAMRAEPNNDFFDMQSKDSIFYKAYQDMNARNSIMGTYFASRLETVYEIQLPIY